MHFTDEALMPDSHLHSAVSSTMMLRVVVAFLLLVGSSSLSLSTLKGIKLKPVFNGEVTALIDTSAAELIKKSALPLSKSDPTVIFAVRRPG